MALQKKVSRKKQRDTESNVFKSLRKKKLRKFKREDRVKYKKPWELNVEE